MNPADWNRHDLLTVAPAGWAGLLETHADLAAIGLLREWAGRGLPVMLRRGQPGDAADGLPVALSLPLGQPRRRVAFMLPAALVTARSEPMLLSDAAHAAPPGWRGSIEVLLGIGARHGVQPRVFGSLMWQALTGLDYVRAGSDLDLLWPAGAPASDLASLLRSIEAVGAKAAPAIDGEVVFAGGEAVQWAELRSALPDPRSEVLVKSRESVRMVPACRFWPGDGAS